jgi:hypothetical protein
MRTIKLVLNVPDEYCPRCIWYNGWVPFCKLFKDTVVNDQPLLVCIEATCQPQIMERTEPVREDLPSVNLSCVLTAGASVPCQPLSRKPASNTAQSAIQTPEDKLKQ